MPDYGTIFAGPPNATMPLSENAELDAATMPGTLVVVNGDNEFAAAATAGARGPFYILSENTFEQQNAQDEIPAGRTARAYWPDESCLFHVLLATGNNVSRRVTQLAVNTSGTLSVATTGQEVLFIAEESLNNTSGSDELILVRPYKGEAD